MTADTTQPGDGDELVQIALPHEDPNATPRRKSYVTDPGFAFSAGSLIGSWFHRLENDKMIWQGVVVAEVAPGVFLLQIDKLDEGAENVQRLATIESMTTDDDGYDWRFYDTEDDARSGYARWVAAERSRA